MAPEASDVRDVTCKNCGAEHEAVVNDSDTIEVCHECCEHENTTTELTGEYCDDCGQKVN